MKDETFPHLFLQTKNHESMYHSKATLADVANIGNLTIAHTRAKQGKSFYTSVQEFEKNKTELLHKLQEELLNGTYRTSPYRKQRINDAGKERLIAKLPYYPDRIVHWAIMLQLEEAFMRRFTADTHAAIPKRGTHTALRRVRRILRDDPEGTQYCLKLDIKKYFPHINHAVLKEQIGKLVGDYELLRLIYEIIDSEPEGLPIGNYLSQYFANLYLSWFDVWVHTELHVKHYVRYMDDIVIFGDSPDELRRVFREVQWYFLRNLYVEIKDNWQIFLVKDRYVDFLGYRIKDNIVMLRKSTWLRLQRKCRHVLKTLQAGFLLTDSMRSTIAAYVGWGVHCSKAVRLRIQARCFAPIYEIVPSIVPKRKKTRKAYNL